MKRMQHKHCGFINRIVCTMPEKQIRFVETTCAPTDEVGYSLQRLHSSGSAWKKA